MGHLYQWGKHSTSSQIQFEALERAALKHGLKHTEVIEDKDVVRNITENVSDIAHWGIDNLDGYWTMIYNSREKKLYIYFETEEDKFGFLLTWL